MSGLVLVIPNWNGEGHLRRLFPSIAAQTRRPDRVLVVDNGSTDGSTSYVRQQGGEVLVLPRNFGFAAAVNRGISATTEPLVGILNNDVVLEPGYLGFLELTLNSGAAFATGKIYQPGRNTVLDATWDLVTRAGLAVRCGHNLIDGAAWNEPREIALAPLTAALFHRTVFERVGGLDERFESYLEDVDFGLRCAVSGLRGRYVPEAQAEHWGSGTLGVWHAATVRRMSRNQVYLVAKHFSSDWPLKVGWPVVAGQLLWGLATVRHGRAGAWLAGKLAGVWNYRRIRSSGESSEARAAVLPLLDGFERELIELQMKTGTDRFWSWYFRCTR